MSVNEVRELTGAEIEHVSGGARNMYDNTEPPLQGGGGKSDLLGTLVQGAILIGVTVITAGALEDPGFPW